LVAHITILKIKITPQIYPSQTYISMILNIPFEEDGAKMDPVPLIIGFAIGVVVVSVAIELGLKRSSKSEPASRHTKKWSISEISNPRIMAEYLGEIELPTNSKLLVNKYRDAEMFAGLNVKKHSGIKGNFIIGDDRALILAGPLKQDEIGIWTVEKDIIEQLKSEFDDMWAQGFQLDTEEKEK
jgi:hypothetical protein